jgi:hypothetical protein
MRIAILADIHGNVLALEAVLADLKQIITLARLLAVVDQFLDIPLFRGGAPLPAIFDFCNSIGTKGRSLRRTKLRSLLRYRGQQAATSPLPVFRAPLSGAPAR